MRRCEHEREVEIQTPTIGRTLRSEALGKNAAIVQDFLQKWKIDGLVPKRFAICPFHLFKVMRLPRKSEAR